MITITKRCSLPQDYPLERLGKLGKLLFFDIETTGFSGEWSTLYLIGCAYWEKGSWNLVQWFADSLDAEKEVLAAFFQFLAPFSALVHFNGDGFDIPFLRKRCKRLGLPYDFSGVESIDIYKKIRPYKGILGLESLKQKAIETFLGIRREDVFSGGQLIQVYQAYLASQDPGLLDLLILHNEDDLKGMPRILPILNYPDFLEHGFSLCQQSIEKQEGGLGQEGLALKLTLKSQYAIPVPFSMGIPMARPFQACAGQGTLARLEAKGDMLTATISLYQGTLKHFFPNYKEYYYLVYEDSAVHKSVAEYVDKSAKVKATAKTCYTKSQGCFLPQPAPLWQPYLQMEYRDRLTYIPYEEGFFQDSEKRNTYIRQLFAYSRNS